MPSSPTTKSTDTIGTVLSVGAACRMPSRCDGRLGYVFPDGPWVTTALRHGSGGGAVKFKPEDG